MDITVIVVTYNQERTIGRTLDSILSQKTTANYEIVIGDDCSDDGTESVCRFYAKSYPDKIRYFRRAVNIGVVDNYFNCISQARGRYLADCAGDDFWCNENKLQDEFKVLESNPDVSLVATQWQYRDENTGEITNPDDQIRAGRYAKGSLLVPILTNSSVVHLCTALYRKDIIIKFMTFHPELCSGTQLSCEDKQILLALSASGDFIVLPYVALNYSIGFQSISHRKEFGGKFDYSLRTVRQIRNMGKVFLDDENNKCHISPDEGSNLNRYYQSHTKYLASMAFRSGDPARRNQLIEYLRDYPACKKGKTRIYLAAMRNQIIWNMMRSFYEFLQVCIRMFRKHRQ